MTYCYAHGVSFIYIIVIILIFQATVFGDFSSMYCSILWKSSKLAQKYTKLNDLNARLALLYLFNALVLID